MSECTTIIALAERLRGHSRVAWRRGRGEFAGDLRLAARYLRRHAALLIADEESVSVISPGGSSLSKRPARRGTGRVMCDVGAAWLIGSFALGLVVGSVTGILLADMARIARD
jgi:hypothetical protein